MPNHVYTTVKIKGTPEEVKNFFATHFTKSFDDNLDFDFNTFIKKPEALSNTPYPVENPNSAKNRELHKLYGANNWYDWSLKNWGTKWNAYDNYIIDENSFTFQTAWSLPSPIFEKMANLYPNMIFELTTFEEGGFFSGTITIANGKVEENLSDDDEKWAKAITEMLGFNPLDEE